MVLQLAIYQHFGKMPLGIGIGIGIPFQQRVGITPPVQNFIITESAPMVPADDQIETEGGSPLIVE